MTAIVVVGCMVAYVVIAAAVWERLRAADGGFKHHLARHRRTAYPSLYHCPKHDPATPGCPECDRIDYGNCSKCNIGDYAIVHEALPGVFWPLMIPISMGVRIGRHKRIAGFRLRKAERLAKRIADAEKEVFGS